MPTYEASISIAASRENIWRVLSDVTAWPNWLPTVAKVEPLDQKSLSVGSRFVVHQPKLRPATWTVSELVPSKSFTWVARSPGMQMTAEHTITEKSPAESSVLLRFSFSGLLGGIVGRLYRSVTENYLAQEATALKRKVEGSVEADA